MYHQRFKTLEQCFWEKAVIRPGCWPWIGAKSNRGRGNFRGKSAPRVAWRLTFGAFQDDLYVCHHCDNPNCVNPAHLFLGTQSDNMIDCSKKGRRSERSNAKSGELHHFAKLKEKDVVRILELSSSMKQMELAKMFGVSDKQISRIVHGQRWKYLGGRKLQSQRLSGVV